MNEEELRQGKIAWDIQRIEYGDEFCNRITDAINTIGLEAYWAFMEVPKDIPEQVRNLFYLSLRYVEYTCRSNAPQN